MRNNSPSDFNDKNRNPSRLGLGFATVVHQKLEMPHSRPQDDACNSDTAHPTTAQSTADHGSRLKSGIFLPPVKTLTSTPWHISHGASRRVNPQQKPDPFLVHPIPPHINQRHPSPSHHLLQTSTPGRGRVATSHQPTLSFLRRPKSHLNVLLVTLGASNSSTVHQRVSDITR